MVDNDFFKRIISCLDDIINVPCLTTVSREVIEMRNSDETKIRDTLSQIPGMVSLTTDAWSSRVYKGYLSITIHWVDKDWTLRNVLLDFVKFPTPHNGENTSTLLFELFFKWNILVTVKAITTDNAPDMCSAMEKLTSSLNFRTNTSRPLITYM